MVTQRISGVRIATVVLACWSAAVALVGTRGNFPIHDDWSFGLTVKHWLETGVYSPGGFTAMTLWTHAAWGALFSQFLGFSFDTLRLSTLVMGALGVMGTYFLVRQVGGSPASGFFASLALGFNPIYFDLSFTFMTDVTFTALATWTGLFMVRYLESGRTRDWVCACMLALGTVMCRELGLCLPIGLAVGILIRRGISRRSLFLAIFPVLVCAGGWLGLNFWLHLALRTPALSGIKERRFLATLGNPIVAVKTACRNFLLILLYLGLFVSPALLVRHIMTRRLDCWDRRNVIAWCAACVPVVAAVRLMAKRHSLMPVSLNFLNEVGIGPLVLRDTFELNLPHVAPLPGWWLATVAVLAVAGLAALVRWLLIRVAADLRMWREPRVGPGLAVRWALLTMACSYCVPIIIVSTFFDRYVLLLVPLCLAVLAQPQDRGGFQQRTLVLAGRRLAGGLAFTFLAVLAVAGTHDHMEWNRVRWQAIDELQSVRGVPARRIDGGFEFNGLLFYQPGGGATPGKSFWWVQDDEYVVAFGPIEGYRVLQRYPCSRWLPAPAEEIVILQRLPSGHGR